MFHVRRENRLTTRGAVALIAVVANLLAPILSPRTTTAESQPLVSPLATPTAALVSENHFSPPPLVTSPLAPLTQNNPSIWPSDSITSTQHIYLPAVGNSVEINRKCSSKIGVAPNYSALTIDYWKEICISNAHAYGTGVPVSRRGITFNPLMDKRCLDEPCTIVKTKDMENVHLVNEPDLTTPDGPPIPHKVMAKWMHDVAEPYVESLGLPMVSPAPSELHPEYLELVWNAYTEAYPNETPHWNALAIHCYASVEKCKDIIGQVIGYAKKWHIPGGVKVTEWGSADPEYVKELGRWMILNPDITEINFYTDFLHGEEPWAIGFPTLFRWDGLDIVPTAVGEALLSLGIEPTPVPVPPPR